MKEEIKNLLEKYVKVNEINVDENGGCTVYVEETILNNTLFDALKNYYFTVWYSHLSECMVITLLEK